MAYGYHLEAEYEDGFILNEIEQNDQSLYTPIELVDGVPTGKNTFYDIQNYLPVPEHGKMVRLTLFAPSQRYDINWSNFPANTKVIHKVWLERNFTPAGGWSEDARQVRRIFGYEYHDQEGNKQKEVLEV